MALRDDAREVLAALEERGRRRGHRQYDGVMGPSFELDGRRVHNFSSNDYLGLAGDVRVAEALARGAFQSGCGAGASRLIVGPREHIELERELASWLGAERVQLFNSGYAANVGVLSTLGGPDAVVFSDELNHASIIDGCRLSRARVVVYRHGDLADLAQKLGEVKAARKLVVSESVFSMDGDIADVEGLADLTRHAGAALLLDEAHAVGVIGPSGRGVAARHGVTPDVLMGTLGKAFGGYGAFVAAADEVVEWLWNRARSLVFSTGLPPAVSAAARAALAIIKGQEGEMLRSKVAANRDRLRELGLSCASHIVPWLVGADSAAVTLSRSLEGEGLFVQAIRPPTVPEGTARLRIALGTHSAEAMTSLISALRRLG